MTNTYAKYFDKHHKRAKHECSHIKSMGMYQIEMDELGLHGDLSYTPHMRQFPRDEFDPIQIKCCPWCGEVFQFQFECECGRICEPVDSHTWACTICSPESFYTQQEKEHHLAEQINKKLSMRARHGSPKMDIKY